MNKIINDNAISILDRMIEKNYQVDLILTDPPYKTTKRGSSGGTGGMLKFFPTEKINVIGKV